MSVTIVEGADFAGKTTYCLDECHKLDFQDINVAYIHFPIRRTEDVMILPSSELLKNKFDPANIKFEFCESFKDKKGNTLSPADIQNIIANNLTTNAINIMKLYDMGFHILIDRYILSNIVYRQFYNINHNFSFLWAISDSYVVKLMSIAKHKIITHDDEVFIKRHSVNHISVDCELDKNNEIIANVLTVNNIYRSYLDQQYIRLSNNGFHVTVVINQ